MNIYIAAKGNKDFYVSSTSKKQAYDRAELEYYKTKEVTCVYIMDTESGDRTKLIEFNGEFSKSLFVRCVHCHKKIAYGVPVCVNPHNDPFCSKDCYMDAMSDRVNILDINDSDYHELDFAFEADGEDE